MTSRPKFTSAQLTRVKNLEQKLRTAAVNRDYAKARVVMADLDSLLKSTGHLARLMKNRNRLFEAAIEACDYEFSEKGLRVVYAKTSENTRVHLESAALLAVCLLRQGRLCEAEEFMEAVLKNDSVIKSERKRAQFRLRAISRFEEAVVLSAMVHSAPKDRPDPADLQLKAGELLQRNISEEELYIRIGLAAPPSASDYILKVDAFSRKRISTHDVKLLPSPEEKKTNKRAGVTVPGAIKRRQHAALCDPQSEIYQAWTKQGLAAVVNKVWIGGAVTTCLMDMGAGAVALAVPIVALIFKLGIEVYCSAHQPDPFME